MARGAWQGLLQGMQMVEEKKRYKTEQERILAEFEEGKRQREEDVSFRREQFDFQKAQAKSAASSAAAAAETEAERWQKNYDLQVEKLTFERDKAKSAEERALLDQRLDLMKQLGVDLPTGVSNTRTAAKEITEYATELKGILGDSKEATAFINKVVGTGNPTDVKKVLDNLNTGVVAAGEEGRADQFIQTFLLGAQDFDIIPSQTNEVDVGALEDVLGETVLSVLPERMTKTTPGSIGFKPVIYQPSASLADLDTAEKRIALSAVEQAKAEMKRLNSAFAKLDDLERSASETEKSLINSTKRVLVGRKQTIQEALDATTGDGASYFGVLGLYGNSSVESILKSSPKKIDPESLRPAFKENLGGTPIDLTDKQAEILSELGYLQGNSMVNITETTEQQVESSQRPLVEKPSTKDLINKIDKYLEENSVNKPVTIVDQKDLLEKFNSGVINENSNVVINGKQYKVSDLIEED